MFIQNFLKIISTKKSQQRLWMKAAMPLAHSGWPMFGSIEPASAALIREALRGEVSVAAELAVDYHPDLLRSPGHNLNFGAYYLRRRRLGVPQVYADGSARILINGGSPITLSVTTQLAEDAEPRLHFQREQMQFYPGEYARQSFPREFFNGLCGGCHGSISGLESRVVVHPDVLTRASDVIAKEQSPTDLREPGMLRAPPFD